LFCVPSVLTFHFGESEGAKILGFVVLIMISMDGAEKGSAGKLARGCYLLVGVHKNNLVKPYTGTAARFGARLQPVGVRWLHFGRT
jgi:hypothetical protein